MSGAPAFAGANQWNFGACPSSLILSRLFGLRSALNPNEAIR